MEKSLIIFGSGDIAELAYYYFSTDSDYKVAAFTLDSEYIKAATFCGLPLTPFESLEQHFPPDQYDLFVALSYAQLNEVRKDKYLAGKLKGYEFTSYISSRATVLNEGRIGENCFILEDNTIQPFVTIGNNVTLWSGNHIGHHSTIRDHCFIASHVVISGGVEIKPQCFLGVNATLRDHIVVGEKCVVGAGALLLGDTAAEGVYIGNKTERSDRPSTTLNRV
jgi:sugar O-acyltransferase (sialic acid O-acetyltransferase NeuD family)